MNDRVVDEGVAQFVVKLERYQVFVEDEAALQRPLLGEEGRVLCLDGPGEVLKGGGETYESRPPDPDRGSYLDRVTGGRNDLKHLVVHDDLDADTRRGRSVATTCKHRRCKERIPFDGPRACCCVRRPVDGGLLLR